MLAAQAEELIEGAPALPVVELGSRCCSSGQMVLQRHALLGQGAFGVALLLDVNLPGGGSFSAAAKLNLVGAAPPAACGGV